MLILSILTRQRRSPGLLQGRLDRISRQSQPMLGRAPARAGLVSGGRRHTLLAQVLVEVLKRVHELHVRANPLALGLGGVVRVVDTELGLSVETVGNDQTGRATGTLLTVNQDFLALLCAALNRFTEMHQVRSNVRVVIPRHVDVLGRRERVRLWRSRCLH